MEDLEPEPSEIERGPIGNDPQRWVARPAPEPQHRQEDSETDEVELTGTDSDTTSS